MDLTLLKIQATSLLAKYLQYWNHVEVLAVVVASTRVMHRVKVKKWWVSVLSFLLEVKGGAQRKKKLVALKELEVLIKVHVIKSSVISQD